MREKKDPELGSQVEDLLKSAGIENPRTGTVFEKDAVKHAKNLLLAVGMSTDNSSTKDTPSRVASMYIEELFWGLDYSNFPKISTSDNDMQYNQHVIEIGIPVRSMCEHHLMPIVGTAAIGYIPKNKVIGLSKMNRVVEFFSRRPQMQERLTQQILETLKFVLGTDDVAVLIAAEHFCVSHRGVGHQGCKTKTSALSGLFMEEPSLKAEFMSLAL